jgi:nucleoside-diphosphate-sugar epimerase
MKVAVLGANGFLGKFITDQLQAHGYDVCPIGRADVNLRDFSSVTRWLKQNKPYAIVNCAIASVTDINICSADDIKNNLDIFLNFYNNKDNFIKFINVGSGAEYDRMTSINNARETDVLTACPKDSYGYSKNVMARLSMCDEKFHTLRLFGCFHASQPSTRLFARVVNGDHVEIVDRQFDYFSAGDFFVVLEHHLNNKVLHRDVNCVYEEKLYLSQILNKIRPVRVTGVDEKNYTGNGSRLADLSLPILGLDESIKEYR